MSHGARWVVALVALSVAVGAAGAPRAAVAAERPDGVGLVDTTQGQWHLRDHEGDVARFFFGNPEDVPVMGDWDGDGVATPGLFRTSDAFAYLSNANRSQVADIRFFFGNPSDVPLAGDWDGDGDDTLSIYRPAEQRFYVVNELGDDDGGLGPADFSFTFGDPGDKPVVGDWDGDGADEVGLHRESTGFFYWRNTLDTGVADGAIFFGDPGDRFVAGDWTGAGGFDTPAVYRPSDTTFYFRDDLTQGTADDQLRFGAGTWLPVAGDFGDLEPSPSAYDQAEIDYFVDIALGSEFGTGSPVVRKWVDDPTVSVHGAPTSGDLAVLDDVIADLNGLVDPFQIHVVAQGAAIEMHFAPVDEFDDILPQYVPGNIGFFWYWFDGTGAIVRAVVLVASDVSPEVRAHLIREELTQSLGLGNDSFQYPDSIFQQAFTLTTTFAPIDEAVISILYEPVISLLMNEAEVRAALG